MSTPRPLIEFDSETITAHVETVADAKLAIKDIRIKKKEFSLARKEVVAQQQAVRADYTDQTRRQGSMMRGGGWFGKMVRAGQSASRDAAKRTLANQLRPLESEKARYDALILACDKMIVQLEAFILEHMKA